MTNILQMSFALVGKHANQDYIQTAIQTILAVKSADLAGPLLTASDSTANNHQRPIKSI